MNSLEHSAAGAYSAPEGFAVCQRSASLDHWSATNSTAPQIRETPRAAAEMTEVRAEGVRMARSKDGIWISNSS
jgi:hypothetical protein